jgi:hypothetical protein
MQKLLDTKKAQLALLVGVVFSLFIVGEGVTLAATLHTKPTPVHKITLQKSSPTQAQPAQGGTTRNQGITTGLRYFAVGTPVGVMQAKASALSKQQVKELMEKEINDSWGVIHSALGFSTKQKAYAFFLGMATRESTINAGLETGTGSAHSYGPIQAAETAYANANPTYMPENDVPEMMQYAFTPENFYDPGIATFMGIRHLIHFSRQAKAEGYKGIELLRHALMGYNTGYVNTTDQGWMANYSDEIGLLAGWYLRFEHLYDAISSWTGDPRVIFSLPWSWY